MTLWELFSYGEEPWLDLNGSQVMQLEVAACIGIPKELLFCLLGVMNHCDC